MISACCWALTLDPPDGQNPMLNSGGSQQKDAGSVFQRGGSQITGGGSESWGGGAEIRRDPPMQFNPCPFVSRCIYSYLRSATCSTLWVKKDQWYFSFITLQNVCRCKKFFHIWIQQEIFNKIVVTYLTIPQLCSHTTLWNVKDQKWQNSDMFNTITSI